MDNLEYFPVSVIIPYSSSHTPRVMLEEAIESVKLQTVPTEVIVVRDSNQHGPAWARNRGLKKADTRFVSFLDADDLWKPHKLKCQLGELRSQGVGLCVEGEEMNQERFIRGILGGQIRSITSSIVIDTTILDLQFRPELDRCEDHLYAAEAAAKGGVCFCKDIVNIRKHQGGLTAKGNREVSATARFQMINIIESELPELKPFQNEVAALGYYLYGRHYQIQTEHRKAVDAFLHSINHKVRYKTLGALCLSAYGLFTNRVRSALTSLNQCES